MSLLSLYIAFDQWVRTLSVLRVSPFWCYSLCASTSLIPSAQGICTVSITPFVLWALVVSRFCSFLTLWRYAPHPQQSSPDNLLDERSRKQPGLFSD